MIDYGWESDERALKIFENDGLRIGDGWGMDGSQQIHIY